MKGKKKPEKWFAANSLQKEFRRTPGQVELARHLHVSNATAATMLYELWDVPRKQRTKAPDEKNRPEAPKGNKPD